MTCLDRSGPDREALMHELDLTDPDIAARRDYSEARTLTRHTSPGPEPPAPKSATFAADCAA